MHYSIRPGMKRNTNPMILLRPERMLTPMTGNRVENAAPRHFVERCRPTVGLSQRRASQGARQNGRNDNIK